MATKSEIEAQLAENEAARNALAAKLGPQQDAAQQAYNTAQFFKPRPGQTYSDSWTGSLNGKTYSDPQLLYQAAQADFETKADLRKQTATEFNALFPVKASLEEQLKTATDPTTTVKTPEATNPSATDTAAAEKQATGTVEGTPPTALDQTKSNVLSAITKPPAPTPSKPTSQPAKPAAATPTFQGGKDHRVRLKVPTTYLVGHAAGPNDTLKKSQGIIFPYTPTVGQEYTATYNSVPVVHSNYTQYFYKNSAVSTISLTAKFTVQNEYEAEVYFSIVHLLRALTKMRWGDDDNAGSPPPVCRLFAYGDAIMNNVPVAISSFKIDLPDNVDYFTTKSQSSAPTISSITLTLTPIYSRNEMQKFTVTDWLSNNLRSKGYL